MGRLRTRCEVGLAGKHSAERWRRCWGGTAGRSLDQTRTSIHGPAQGGSPGFGCPPHLGGLQASALRTIARRMP